MKFGEIRTSIINNEPYLMLNDVCRILDIKNPRDIKSRLNSKGVDTTGHPHRRRKSTSYIYKRI